MLVDLRKDNLVVMGKGFVVRLPRGAEPVKVEILTPLGEDDPRIINRPPKDRLTRNRFKV